MNLLSKKPDDLTDAEYATLFKAIGTSDIPYPETYHEMTQEGLLRIRMGARATDNPENAILIPSNRSYRQVVGLAYSNMAVPSALAAEREAYSKIGPNSKSRILLFLGKPGWGKTQLAENIAQIMDQRPPIFINFSGRNLKELIWTTVIDIGEDYKTALRSRVRGGSMRPDSRQILQENFPSILVHDSSGHLIDLDFTRSTLRPEEGKAPKEILRDNNALLREIADNEGIPVHAANILGMREVPGPLKLATEQGLVIIADELTKGLDESQILEGLQWLAGLGKDEITFRSTMSVNGRDETAEYTLNRADVAVGFNVLATGNLTDPMLSRNDAAPAWSRMPKIVLPDPEIGDWAPRISQILTGLPLTTHVSFFEDVAHGDPDDFLDMLVSWRKEKAEAEGHSVPQEHRERIENWPRTRMAAIKLAEGLDYVSRLLNSKSDLYDTDKAEYDQAALDRREMILPEISAQFSAMNPIDPRIFIHLMNCAEASSGQPVTIGKDGYKPRFNRNAFAESGFTAVRVPRKDQNFGTNLRFAIERWVADLTAGRPQLQRDIIREFRERGIAFTAPGQDKTVEKLLNPASFVGKERSVDLRSTLDTSADEGVALLDADTSLTGEALTVPQAPAIVVPASYTPGELVPKKGVFLGVWGPKDREQREIGRSFNLFAAPHDFGKDENGAGHRSTQSYSQTLAQLLMLKSYMGFRAEPFDTDADLYRALRNGSYKGGWFIPTKDILSDNLGGGTHGIFRLKNTGAMARTFETSFFNAAARHYWSCTQHDNGSKTHFLALNMSDGSLVWERNSRTGYSVRLTRAEPI